jgi:hypothetical protein
MVIMVVEDPLMNDDTLLWSGTFGQYNDKLDPAQHVMLKVCKADV